MNGLLIRCQHCTYETPEELGYCLKCRATLVPENNYDLNFADYAYKPDLNAIETLKGTGSLPYLIKRLMIPKFEKAARSKLAVEAHQVDYPSKLDTLVRKCANLLSIDFMPEVFVTESGQPNAFTFGSDEHAYVVVDALFLRAMTSNELMAVLGHELAHVKSGHMLFHTLAEALRGGISVSASLLGLDVFSLPLRLALLSWHRESEVTADRASLLVVNNIETIKSLMMKLARFQSREDSEPTSLEGANVGLLESASELLQTHPLLSKRYTLLKEFWQSGEYLKVRQKMELRQTLLKGLNAVCRFCGAKKRVGELFCPRCGKSQV